MNPNPVVEASVSSVAAPKNAEPRTSPAKGLELRTNVSRSARLYRNICLLVLLILASASSFSAFYEKWHFREAGARGVDVGAEFDQMMDGTAHRPYIYRQLLPDTANWLARVLPVDAITRQVPKRARDRIDIALSLGNKVHPVQYVIVYIATYLSALLAAFALYQVCTAAKIPQPTAVFAPVLFMLVFPLIGIKGGYFFDFPELLFMAVAFWMALEFDWWWIIPIAALGAWNKETFLLFMFTLYPLFRRRQSRLSSLLGVCVLTAVCIAVYLPIRLHFALNPGGFAEWHLKGQIAFFLHPFRLETWVDRTYDLLFPALSGPIPFLFLIWTVWRGWRYLPFWLKRHALISAIINIPLYLLFCEPGEFRDLSLLFISFLFIIASNLQEWIDSTKPKLVESPA
jgi:hypothetical protein